MRSLVGGVAVAAAVRTWPFRVYSFSSEIVKPQEISTYGIQYISSKQMFPNLSRSVYPGRLPEKFWLPCTERFMLLTPSFAEE